MAACVESRDERTIAMATYVLVHGGTISTGTWNRLRNRNDYPPGGHLGPHCWNRTKAYLESHGHTVFTPALGDENTHSLSDHIRQVCTVIEAGGPGRVILVGHSYGGFVITGAAARLPERIRHLVYLDSALPDPGESLIGVLKDAYSGEPAAALPDPCPAYNEKIRYDPAVPGRLKKTYIRCTKSEFSAVTRRAQEKIEALPGQWTYLELPSSHVPMADMPARFYRVMLALANR